MVMYDHRATFDQRALSCLSLKRRLPHRVDDRPVVWKASNQILAGPQSLRFRF